MISKERLNKFWEILQIIIGIPVLLAFVGIFFVKRFPIIEPYVHIVIFIYAAIMGICLLGIILWAIGIGAGKAIELYKDTMGSLKVGILGRILWAILFIACFIIAIRI